MKQYLYNLIDEVSKIAGLGIRYFDSQNSENKNIRIIPINLPIEEVRITVGDREYSLTEHHISIYENPITSGKFKNHYHYTATYIHEGKSYKAHIYFNDNDIVNSQVLVKLVSVKQGDTKQEFIDLTQTQQQELLDRCHFVVSPIFSKIRAYQLTKVRLLKAKIAQLDKSASELSHNISSLDTHREYCKLLDEQILLHRELSKYDPGIRPLAIIRILENLKLAMAPVLAVTVPIVEDDSKYKSSESRVDDTDKDKLDRETPADAKDLAQDPSQSDSKLDTKSIQEHTDSSINVQKSINFELQSISRDLTVRVPVDGDSQQNINILKRLWFRLKRVNERINTTGLTILTDAYKGIELRFFATVKNILNSSDLITQHFDWLVNEKDILSIIDIPDDLVISSVMSNNSMLLGKIISNTELSTNRKYIFQHNGNRYNCNLLEACVVLNAEDCFGLLLRNGYSPYSFESIESPLMQVLLPKCKVTARLQKILLESTTSRDQDLTGKRLVCALKYFLQQAAITEFQNPLYLYYSVTLQLLELEQELKQVISKKDCIARGRLQLRKQAEYIGRLADGFNDSEIHAFSRNLNIVFAKIESTRAKIRLFSSHRVSSRDINIILRTQKTLTSLNDMGMHHDIPEKYIEKISVATINFEIALINRLCGELDSNNILQFTSKGPQFRNIKAANKYARFVAEQNAILEAVKSEVVSQLKIVGMLRGMDKLFAQIVSDKPELDTSRTDEPKTHEPGIGEPESDESETDELKTKVSRKAPIRFSSSQLESPRLSSADVDAEAGCDDDFAPAHVKRFYGQKSRGRR